MFMVWLAAGVRITLLLDRIVTWPSTGLSTRSVRYDVNEFRLGDHRMEYAGPDNMRIEIEVVRAIDGRITLVWNHDSFPLGLTEEEQIPAELRFRPLRLDNRLTIGDSIRIRPDEGDDVSFRRGRSLVGWPVFELNFFTSNIPLWRRFVYYTLIWTKRSGARLKMVWRYEQKYDNKGWDEPLMLWNSRTGLTTIEIHPEPGFQSAVRYIEQTRHWNRADFRVERQPAEPGQESFVMIHRDDERGIQPGAGKSVALVLDASSHKVLREIAFQ
jgi:hypothetical protein